MIRDCGSSVSAEALVTRWHWIDSVGIRCWSVKVGRGASERFLAACDNQRQNRSTRGGRQCRVGFGGPLLLLLR